jgi:hypothetical protein
MSVSRWEFFTSLDYGRYVARGLALSAGQWVCKLENSASTKLPLHSCPLTNNEHKLWITPDLVSLPAESPIRSTVQVKRLPSCFRFSFYICLGLPRFCHHFAVNLASRMHHHPLMRFSVFRAYGRL